MALQRGNNGQRCYCVPRDASRSGWNSWYRLSCLEEDSMMGLRVLNLVAGGSRDGIL